MYRDTLSTINFGAIVLLLLDKQPPFQLLAKTDSAWHQTMLPGTNWVILHTIYTPIMSNVLVRFVTYRAVTNVLTL